MNRRTTKPLISPINRYFWNPKKPAIFDLNHNLEGWIRTSGLALFIALKPHFSGLWFDSRFKNAIGCMYPFQICKIAEMHVFSETVEKGIAFERFLH